MSSKGKKRKTLQSQGEPPPKRLSRRRLVIEDDDSELADDNVNTENFTTSNLSGDEHVAASVSDAAIARSFLDVEAEEAGSQEDSEDDDDGDIDDEGEEIEDEDEVSEGRPDTGDHRDAATGKDDDG